MEMSSCVAGNSHRHVEMSRRPWLQAGAGWSRGASGSRWGR